MSQDSAFVAAEDRQADALKFLPGWKGGIFEAVQSTSPDNISRSKLADRSAHMYDHHQPDILLQAFRVLSLTHFVLHKPLYTSVPNLHVQLQQQLRIPQLICRLGLLRAIGRVLLQVPCLPCRWLSTAASITSACFAAGGLPLAKGSLKEQ